MFMRIQKNTPGIIKTISTLLVGYLLWTVNLAAFSNNLHKPDNIDLSNKAVLCMHQDQNGFLWLGTYDGLNLYNSKNVFVYRFDLQIEKSLCSNIIHKITPAEKDHLWISTFLGLNKFSISNREVLESYPECPEAKLLASDESGNTCVLLQDDLIHYYTPETKKFSRLPLKGILKNDIKAIFAGDVNIFYLLTAKGEQIQLNFNKLEEETSLTFSKDLIHKYPIHIAFVEGNTLFFVDKNGWLYARNIQKSQTVFIRDIKPLLDSYGIISQIVSFQNDIYLAFKSNGVLKLARNRQFEAQKVNMEIGVFSLLKDTRQNILWIGTDGQGVQMYFDKPTQFHNLTLEQLPFNLQKPVRAIYTESNNLWIGTKGGGIVFIRDYDKLADDKLLPEQCLSYTTDNGLSSNQVFSLRKSQYHNLLWIGTEGPGLSCFSFENKSIYTPSELGNGKIEKVHSICETNDSTLWLATAGAGLKKVNYRIKSGRIEIKDVETFVFEKNGRVCNEFHATRDIGNSTLLIGSRGGYGLIKFDTQTYQYSFIPMNNTEYSAIGDVLSVHHSIDSLFYIGASAGLTKMQFLPNNQFRLLNQFDRRYGLSNDMIHGILEGLDGCIWLSTNKGLTKYNPENDYFHNYTQDLLVSEFSDDAFWQDPNSKRLFFGGVNGLVWLEATTIPTPAYKTNFSFYELKLSGKPVRWSDHFNTAANQISIPPGINSFSVSFVAVDNYNADDYEYAYFLEGYDHQWVKLQNNNEASFNGLSPGDYQLHVKYNNDVFNSELNKYTLNLKVLPPWYLTTGMMVVYLMITIALLVLSIYITRKNINKKQLAITRKIEEEQREQLLETKLNFFTNITHELCTPLTLINGLTDQITQLSDNKQPIKEYASVLQNNVTSLNELIQEILDFRKIEDSEFGMCRIEKVSVTSIVQNISELFYSISEQNSIQYKINVPESLYWNTDPTYLKKILTNLVSNAFKYTDQGGKIEITAYTENNQLTIKVFNTGRGIEESERQNIFNRFKVINSEREKTNIAAAARTGLGLSICKSLVNTLKGNIEVSSEVGKYAEFIIVLPGLQATASDSTIQKPGKERVSDKFEPENNSPRPTVLVVDDNQDITWLISQTLSPYYEIKEASSATEALEKVKEKTPDLIITDIMMPEVSGLVFLNQIKTGAFTKHIPVIIVSAKVTDNEQAEGFNTGADAYLTKPFSSQLLLSVVSRLLKNKTDLKSFYHSSESVYEFSEGRLIHSEDKQLLEKVISIIKDNIDNEELRPGFLADKLGMNLRSFYRYFKNFSDMAPSDFIKDYRLMYAAQLLRTTKLNVQEIIYKTGFTNKSYFYREFLKKHNMTPKEYRQQEEVL